MLYFLAMRILALETNVDKVKHRFLSPEERELLTVHYHWMKFVGSFFWSFLLTAIIIAIAWATVFFAEIDMFFPIVAGVAVWLVFVFPGFLRAWIDWQYDYILLTTDKIVIMDQTSIFKQKVTPISLENISSVAAETQWGDLFPFGVLHLDLLEGAGVEYKLRFIAHAEDVASKIAESLTMFQRRKDLRRYPHEIMDDQA